MHAVVVHQPSCKANVEQPLTTATTKYLGEGLLRLPVSFALVRPPADIDDVINLKDTRKVGMAGREWNDTLHRYLIRKAYDAHAVRLIIPMSRRGCGIYRLR